jgi:hypothetical protein
MRWDSEKTFNHVDYDLADMPNETGGAMHWDIYVMAGQIASLLVDQRALSPAYRQMVQLLPAEKLPIYFKNHVKRIVIPPIRALHVARWHARHGKRGPAHEVQWRGHGGLGQALQEVWSDPSIPLFIESPDNPRLSGKTLLRGLRNTVKSAGWKVRTSLGIEKAASLPVTPENTVAVHYREGIDLSRRSDIFWNKGLLVEPGRILILIDGTRGAYKGVQIPEEVLQEIEDTGMQWVCLERGQVARSGAPVWSQDSNEKVLVRRFQQERTAPSSSLEKWADSASLWLLGQVDYWVSLFTRFNVKALVDVAGANHRHMAQSIALDLLDGVRVGWQRSEQMTVEGTYIGHHSNHVFFTWNARTLAGPAPGRQDIGPVLVSGFPYDQTWEDDGGPQQLRQSMAENGARFTVALFDNMIMRHTHLSRSMMLGFYRSFLEWVLAEPEVGVITKSKKPAIIQELPEIHGLMAEAEATGRWINLTDVFGRLPSDASRAADISVGIGISTAASEAVAAGGRAIHCDLPAMRSHPFYQWGYNKVVFDDMDRMMNALKRYMVDPASEPGLGDFSSAMDQIDPFCDGRAGERIGSYIANLLQSFDSDLNRDQAINKANKDYALKWGQESVRQAEYWSREHTTTL